MDRDAEPCPMTLALEDLRARAAAGELEPPTTPAEVDGLVERLRRTPQAAPARERLDR